MLDTIWVEKHFTWKPGEEVPSIKDWLNEMEILQVSVTAFNVPGDHGGMNCLLVMAQRRKFFGEPPLDPLVWHNPIGTTCPPKSTTMIKTKMPLEAPKKGFMTDAEVDDILPERGVKKAKRSSKQK